MSGIFVAGHRGLVGSAIVRALVAGGHREDIVTRTRADLDLRDAIAVERFFDQQRPEVVFVAAARVGGIQANNTYRWDFIYENLQIETNVIGSALRTGVRRLVFFGSSCIYPKHAPQPIREEALLTGPLEPTNEPYAIAKIAGVKLVDAANAQFGTHWVSLMPTNLYGPNDNFDLETSHVLPALIRKFDAATESGGPVVVWGSGTPRREFLHVDDLARAALHAMDSDMTGLFNVGYGDDVTVCDLAGLVAQTVGYRGEIEWDRSKPDGTPRKLMDSSRFRATGWAPVIGLPSGLASTYEWYVQHVRAVA